MADDTPAFPGHDRRLIDERRLRCLDRSQLLDSPAEPAYDRWTKLAARLLDVPVALVSLVDDRRQFFKSQCGLAGWPAERRGTPLSYSLCRHVVEDGSAVVIGDARRDARVASSPAVSELGAVAYLGVPLRAPEGHVLGALCALDARPRDWSPEQVALLTDLSAGIESEIRAHVERRDRERLEQIVASHHDVHELIAAGAPLDTTLDALVRGVEQQSDGMLASLLLVDPDGRRLSPAAAPSLPSTYNDALIGIEIGPCAGSCGTAAHRRERVIVEDVLADPLWDRYRGLAADHGLRACWSIPVFAGHGDVVGTFALYDRRPRGPTLGELELVAHASALAGIAVERHRAHSTSPRWRPMIRSPDWPTAFCSSTGSRTRCAASATATATASWRCSSATSTASN